MKKKARIRFWLIQEFLRRPNPPDNKTIKVSVRKLTKLIAKG